MPLPGIEPGHSVVSKLTEGAYQRRCPPMTEGLASGTKRDARQCLAAPLVEFHPRVTILRGIAHEDVVRPANLSGIAPSVTVSADAFGTICDDGAAVAAHVITTDSHSSTSFRLRTIAHYCAAPSTGIAPVATKPLTIPVLALVLSTREGNCLSFQAVIGCFPREHRAIVRRAYLAPSYAL